MIPLFEKDYDGESLCDLGRDVHEVLSSEFNEQVAMIPQDEHGFCKGTFTVTITWVE
jgi:hypothetical protein